MYFLSSFDHDSLKISTIKMSRFSLDFEISQDFVFIISPILRIGSKEEYYNQKNTLLSFFIEDNKLDHENFLEIEAIW